MVMFTVLEPGEGEGASHDAYRVVAPAEIVGRSGAALDKPQPDFAFLVAYLSPHCRMKLNSRMGENRLHVSSMKPDVLPAMGACLSFGVTCDFLTLAHMESYTTERAISTE